MSDLSWKTVNGILMTSERISAYGGMSFPREMLEMAAGSIRSGTVPMHIEHDLSKPIRTRNADAYVDTRPDGIHVLRFSYDIHVDDAHWLESISGMSTTITVPIDRQGKYVEPTDPAIEVSADYAWFPDELLLLAEQSLVAGGVSAERVKAERAYQFSFTPDPQIFLSLELDLLISLTGNVIWAAIVNLVRGRRTPEEGNPDQPTIINIKVVDGDNSLTAIVQTNDEDVAIRALDKLDSLAAAMKAERTDSAPKPLAPSAEVPRRVVTWDDPAGGWVPPK